MHFCDKPNKAQNIYLKNGNVCRQIYVYFPILYPYVSQIHNIANPYPVRFVPDLVGLIRTPTRHFTYSIPHFCHCAKYLVPPPPQHIHPPFLAVWFLPGCLSCMHGHLFQSKKRPRFLHFQKFLGKF
jgi:hypothetical protein